MAIISHWRKVDHLRDAALRDSFPASDPPSSNVAERCPVRPVGRRPALIDPGLVDELARAAGRKQRIGQGATRGRTRK